MNDCWLWGGFIDSNGYGMLYANGKNHRAHRVVYESEVGPIPEGLCLDHLCRVRHCVNPAHLEPVDNTTNILRGIAPSAINARKTKCIRGHDLADAYITVAGWRKCSKCWPKKAKYIRTKRRLTVDEVHTIRRLRSEGMPMTHIARNMGLRYHIVRFCIDGRSYANV